MLSNTKRSSILIILSIGSPNSLAVADIIRVPADHPTIQAGIDAAGIDDEVVVSPGVYHEYLNLSGKQIILRSTDPLDPDIVAATIIDGRHDVTPLSLIAFGGSMSSVHGFTIKDTGSAVLGVFSGAGVHTELSSALVANCVFTGHLQGAIASENSIFLNCSFTGNNTAVLNIGNGNSHPHYINCLFSQNNPLDPTTPSVMWSRTSSPTLTNCTVVQNGGFAFESLDGAITTLASSILWDNQEPDFVDGGGGLAPQLHYCNTDRGYAGTGNINADPMFTSGFEIGAGSPCIDAGRNSPFPPDVLTDLGHRPRFVDDPDTVDTGLGTAPIIDIGAYEFQATAPDCPADLSGSADPNDPGYGVPDGNLDANDFFFYLALFGAGDLAADLTGSINPNDPGYGIPDGSLDANDFFFYLDLFAAGCP